MSNDLKVKVLYVSAELLPLLKTGGLADVAGALPPAIGWAAATGAATEASAIRVNEMAIGPVSPIR